MLLGYKDRVEKKIFKESRIVVHPAVYETGAIAPADAMACGLPSISFDLPAFRIYYPRGIIKIPKFDLKTFAKSVIDLLSDEKLYKTLRKEAIELTKEMDWDRRAGDSIDDEKSLFLKKTV
jgi:glycosyltransferase involved in cell wall biosynthesis